MPVELIISRSREQPETDGGKSWDMTEDTSENRVIETEENDPVEAGKMYTGKTKISDVIKFAICNAGGAFGEKDLPKPATIVMQYTGLNEYSKNDPPTFVTVGENDGIANWRVMKRRLDGMSALGIPTEFHSYPGLQHGFGIGTGTIAEGWINGFGL